MEIATNKEKRKIRVTLPNAEIVFIQLENVKVMVLGAGRFIGSGIAQRMDTVPILARQMRGFVPNSGFGLQAFGSSGFGGAEKN